MILYVYRNRAERSERGRLPDIEVEGSVLVISNQARIGKSGSTYLPFLSDSVDHRGQGWVVRPYQTCKFSLLHIFPPHSSFHIPLLFKSIAHTYYKLSPQIHCHGHRFLL